MMQQWAVARYAPQMDVVHAARKHAAFLFDAGLVLALACTALYEIWSHPLSDDGIPGPRVANTFLMMLIAVPLLWRRRLPVAVFAVVLVTAGAQIALIDHGRSDQPPAQLWLAALIVFYSLASHASRRRAMIAGLIGGAAVVSANLAALAISAYAPPEETIPGWFLFAAAFGLGIILRGRRMEATFQAQRAERAEREREERARLAVAGERARISRELHDVLAHAMSVIVVQAQAAQRVLDGEQASAREALTSIETNGRQALTEMRRLLGVLRKEDRDLALTPQPSLAHIEELVAQVREAGLAIDFRIEGEPRPLPLGVDLSAYRIVQEALTNTLKHAGPAGAAVVIRYVTAAIELEILDDGRGPGAADGSGHGLVGMQERAALLGGVLESGALSGGGYAVRARLPA